MENVDQADQKKKSPFKFALPLILLLVIGIIGFGVYEYFRIAPRDVRFTNVTSSSVTVSWNTKSPTSATALAFEGDTLLPLTVLGLGGERFYDTRDVRVAELNAAAKAGTSREDLSLTMDDFETEIVVEDMGEYYTHHVTITGLDSETEYSFMVGDQLLFPRVKDINRAKVVKTLVVPESIESPYPAYGSVKDAGGSYEKPLEDLLPVSDAIVYFNYYDELTEESSSVFSSPVTEDGNWYMDVSMARDSSGQSFLETYGTVDSEIFVDLVVDAGEYGIWDVRSEDLSMSPAEPVVVNFPEKANVIDVQNPMERQGVEFGLLSNPFIQAVLAARPVGETPSGCGEPTNTCQFVGYCGPCQRKCDDGYWYDCNCPQGTLSARNCTGAPSTPENPITCGGVALDTVEKVGTDCKVCSKVPHANGYDVGKWVTDNTKYDPAKNCAKRTACTPKTCASYSQYSLSTTCTDGGEFTCTKNAGLSNGCEGLITCWERSSCNQKTCAQASNGIYVHSSETACETGGYTCSSGTFNDGCSGTKTCWKRNGCTPDTCSEASDGTHTYASKTSCESGGHSCSSGSFSNGCGSNMTCWKRGECVPFNCVEAVRNLNNPEDPRSGYLLDTCEVAKHTCPNVTFQDGCGGTIRCWQPGDLIACTKSCAELDDTYNLDSCVPVVGETNCYKLSLVDNCGNPRVCYDERSVIVDYENPEGGKFIPLKANPSIPAGTKCPKHDVLGYEVELCNCIGGFDRYSYPGEWCRETGLNPILGAANAQWRNCKNGSEEGQVCWKSGLTCKEGVNPWGSDGLFCNGAPPVVLNLPEKDSIGLFSSGRYVKGLYALDGGIQYLLDSETGMFVNLPLGVYVVEYEGETYSVRVDNAGEQVQTLLYIDVNENGQYDEGVDTNLGGNAAILNISPVELVYTYSLKKGFNFVAFPFLVQTDYDISSAAALLLGLNERYDNAIYSVSKYDGRWKMVGQNSELYGANDFQLLPGQGYVIKAKEDVSITLTGQPVKYESAGDSAPVTLFEGWNLIGLYGTGVKTYTAKTMIADINAANFTADNVSKWEKEKQSYEGFQFSEGQEYGFDFPINSLEAVFVRVLEGRGNWQPKLGSQ